MPNGTWRALLLEFVMRSAFFFKLCFIISLICTAPLAILNDANGLNALTNHQFLAGLLAMVVSAVGIVGTMFSDKA